MPASPSTPGHAVNGGVSVAFRLIGEAALEKGFHIFLVAFLNFADDGLLITDIAAIGVIAVSVYAE
tara:strand:- start:2813 stop:3010 length:198 start_codon:yes stop_codon:yes gene_type:complete